jgi:hypothetical protein
LLNTAREKYPMPKIKKRGVYAYILMNRTIRQQVRVRASVASAHRHCFCAPNVVAATTKTGTHTRLPAFAVPYPINWQLRWWDTCIHFTEATH